VALLMSRPAAVILPMVRSAPRVIVWFAVMLTPVKLAVKSTPSAMVPPDRVPAAFQLPVVPSHVPSAAWMDDVASSEPQARSFCRA